MYSGLQILAAATLAGQAFAQSTNTTLLTDLSVISQYWGQISTYQDNAETYFGVDDVGLPDGCQIEQVHSLQRHAQRFPTSEFDDGLNDENFAAKVMNFTKANPGAKFTGPLTFLNTYSYIMGESYVCVSKISERHAPLLSSPTG